MFDVAGWGSGRPTDPASGMLQRVMALHKVEGVGMPIRPKIDGGFLPLLCLGIIWGALLLPLQAGESLAHPINKNTVPSAAVQPGVPQASGPLDAPPVFTDRSTPISERPFATPFIDRSSPISERPLAPIGNGPQAAPGVVPLIWCHGEWVRADSPGHRCS